MSKPLLSEGLMGRIMQLVFMGKLGKFKKKIASNKELNKATKDFEKAAQKYEKVIQRYEKRGVELKVGKGIDLSKYEG